MNKNQTIQKYITTITSSKSKFDKKTKLLKYAHDKYNLVPNILIIDEQKQSIIMEKNSGMSILNYFFTPSVFIDFCQKLFVTQIMTDPKIVDVFKRLKNR